MSDDEIQDQSDQATTATASAPVELAPPVTSQSTATDEPSTEPPTSTLDPEEVDRLRRVPFGSRYLTNPDDVYSFNAWDHVVPPPEWEVQAKQTLGIQREGKVSDEMKCKFEVIAIRPINTGALERASMLN